MAGCELQAVVRCLPAFNRCWVSLQRHTFFIFHMPVLPRMRNGQCKSYAASSNDGRLSCLSNPRNNNESNNPRSRRLLFRYILDADVLEEISSNI